VAALFNRPRRQSLLPCGRFVFWLLIRIAKDTMTTINLDDWLDDYVPASASGGRRRKPARRSQAEKVAELVEHGAAPGLNTDSVFLPTFTASRHERDWILNYLGAFYEDRQITDVLRKVKGGKEANVYCCQAHPDTGLDLVAAKVYRPRMFRQLRNDARYRQGRRLLGDDGKEVRDGRRLRAVAHKTEFGREVQHASWLEHEYQTLLRLYEAGVEVPQPLARGNNTILMEYLGEVDTPAPTLNQVPMERREAQALFERLMGNVESMLACGRVHADLSAYNVLYWDGEVCLIDFPQAVDPAVNPDAEELFRRDVERLCQHFARFRVKADASALASAMWARHVPAAEQALDWDDEGGEE
jgi:RIO kinase 1